MPSSLQFYSSKINKLLIWAYSYLKLEGELETYLIEDAEYKSLLADTIKALWNHPAKEIKLQAYQLLDSIIKIVSKHPILQYTKSLLILTDHLQLIPQFYTLEALIRMGRVNWNNRYIILCYHYMFPLSQPTIFLKLYTTITRFVDFLSPSSKATVLLYSFGYLIKTEALCSSKPRKQRFLCKFVVKLFFSLNFYSAFIERLYFKSVKVKSKSSNIFKRILAKKISLLKIKRPLPYKEFEIYQ